MRGKNEEAGNKGRRDFLKLATLSAPAAAVAVTAGTTETEAKASASKDRMQDTAHTRAYFDSARF